MLVRPWRDARGGGGCCGGEVRGGICLDHRVDYHDHDHGHDHDPVSAAYRLLREQEPTVDVQVVSAGNVAYLVPASFRDARRRFGTWAAVRHALRSTTAGAVLVDGVVAGDIEQLGADGVLRVVRERRTVRPAAAPARRRPRYSA